QLTHAVESALPQLEQNFAPSGFAAPQLAQFMSAGSLICNFRKLKPKRTSLTVLIPSGFKKSCYPVFIQRASTPSYSLRESPVQIQSQKISIFCSFIRRDYSNE